MLPTGDHRPFRRHQAEHLGGRGRQAELFVDGVRIGKASQFQEPNRLMLAPGSHRISIREGSGPAFGQEIFIESEHKTIIAR